MKTVITREARRFGAQELARRAGADASECIIEVSDRQTALYLDGNRSIEVIFPHLVQQFNRDASPAVHCSWLSPVSNSTSPLVPNFVVPFCHPVANKGPLFRVEGRRVRCAVDLTASVLFSLCRVEERLSSDRDRHGRFPAAASAAAREDYLNRPIVDEYGLALVEAVQHVAPAWRPLHRQFRAFITQDVDSIGIPFNARSTASRFAHTRQFGGTIRDIGSLFGAGISAELGAVRDIARTASDHGFRSASFWKTQVRTSYDVGYDVCLPVVSRVISELRGSGVDIGIHPSYETFADRRKLAEEVHLLREKLGQDRVGGRQHYLRWRPETWSDWESCGLSYDSSVGFADRPGFRAGTALPYRPWLLDENRQATLLEIPLILMDATLSEYMRLSGADALSLASDLIARTKEIRGVFTLLWHNSVLLNPQYRRLYEVILEQLAGAAPYGLASELHLRRVDSAA